MSYCFRHVYYFTDMSSNDDTEDTHAHSSLLAPVPRSRSASKEGFETRCFMRADRVVSAYDRQPFECVGYCSRHFVGEALGVVQHYTKECIWEDRNRFLECVSVGR